MTSSSPVPQLPSDVLPPNVDAAYDGVVHAEESQPPKNAYTRLRPRNCEGFVASVAPTRPIREPSEPELHEEPATSCQSHRSESVTSISSDADIDENVPERILSAAQQQQQRAELRRNWDFSVILDCFEVFEEELDVEVQHIDTLEDDIVCSVGIAPDRLSKIHEKLLKGISGNSKVTEHNWHFYAAGWLAVYFELDPKDNPMHNTERGCEAAAYAQLSAQLRESAKSIVFNPRSRDRSGNPRCIVLRALCELRCDREDCRAVVELSQKSEKQQIKALSAGSAKVTEEDLLEPDDFNKEPWGCDAEDRDYWLHDLGNGRGLRLCREEPPSEPAHSGSKRCRVLPDLEAGAWETIACGIDEIEQVGMKLCKTKKKADVLLGKALCNELVAEWREAEAERRRREELKAAKLQQQLALEEAGRSRCLRDRKKVNYKFPQEIDCLLREALRAKVPSRSARARAVTVSSDAPLATDADAVSIDATECRPARAAAAGATSSAVSQTTLGVERRRRRGRGVYHEGAAGSALREEHSRRRDRGATPAAYDSSCGTAEAPPPPGLGKTAGSSAHSCPEVLHERHAGPASGDAMTQHMCSDTASVAQPVQEQLRMHRHSEGSAVQTASGGLYVPRTEQNHRHPQSRLQEVYKRGEANGRSFPPLQPAECSISPGHVESSTGGAWPSSNQNLHHPRASNAACDALRGGTMDCIGASSAPSIDAAAAPGARPPLWQRPELPSLWKDDRTPSQFHPHSASTTQPCLAAAVAVAAPANGLLHNVGSGHACDGALSPARRAPQQAAGSH